MKTLYLERSGNGPRVQERGRDGAWTERLDLDGVQRIVVGTGPGSFAGIRAAIAFAQGYALGTKCEVLGLPSACACAGDGKLAVLGDARRGKIWIALFDGYELMREVFQVDESALMDALPLDYRVVTVDEERIGEKLKAVFGARYLGGSKPNGEGLRRFAEANPGILKPEPLPIYLNPAVR